MIDLQKNRKQHYTVVGIWSDTGQRYANWFAGDDADDAESICSEQNPGLLICAVIRGIHEAAESRSVSDIE
jgi:hypothetical protein